MLTRGSQSHGLVSEINTQYVQNRNYVVKEERPGVERNYTVLTLQDGKIKKEEKTEITGAEKNKLFPTDIGIVVNDFLMDNFDQIMDYNFTANVEKEFDEIAQGKKIWNEMIKEFYSPFHDRIQDTLEKSKKQRT